MKKFLFISINDHTSWGGSEVLWSRTASFLSKKYKVSALFKKWKAEPIGILQLKQNGVKIIYKQPEVNIERSNSFARRLSNKFTRGKNHDLDIIKDSPDLVVLSLGNHVDLKLLYYCDYLIKNDIPYVILLQLVTDLRPLIGQYIDRFRKAYLSAKRIYFLSEENKIKAEINLASSFQYFSYINNPFPYGQSPLDSKTKDNYYNLACVASLFVFHKGQELLLNVLSNNKWKKRKLKINLYGKGPGKYQLEELVKFYNLEKQVNFMGYESNKEKIWQKNHACILPSRMEGQSLAMLEAMAYGRMVITTKVGDAERLVKNKETGFLIAAPTIDLIDEALEAAWENREKWIEMGKAGYTHLYDIIKKDPIEDFAAKLEQDLV
ncbi:glycosyltransferase family 4 protein [Christiangramia echinicola]|uniref:Glycosyltransferase involved in cell wall bisynthesis n=1 Tax=Christiangramia echinicola TaxID=279359 RepID=A0A1H1L3P8_9FLAO|nr:glycosyltransferase family 4 protein [Christiangramia echinicola]SDR69188.1 Glycosyltransferase involved in cell wall bisynthesis [Christiangramia echinicola]